MPKLPVAAFIISSMTIILSGSFVADAFAQNIIGYSESKVTVESEKTYCISSKTLQLTDVSLLDVEGNRVENAAAGSQVLVEASVTSSCEIDNYPILTLVEVRDPEGMTNYFAYQNTTMNPGERITTSFSWLASKAGDYRVKVASIACLSCSGDFGVIKIIDFSVLSESKDLERFTLSTENGTIDIPYRFSSGVGKIQDMEVQLYWPTITLTVDNPQDSMLEIHLPVELLKQLEVGSNMEYCVGFPLVVIVDNETTAESDLLEQDDTKEVLAIQLESGSKVVEIVGASLLYEPSRCD